MAKCCECGVELGSGDTGYTCNSCKKRHEYYPFLEKLGEIHLYCPFCQKDITGYVNKRENPDSDRAI